MVTNVVDFFCEVKIKINQFRVISNAIGILVFEVLLVLVLLFFWFLWNHFWKVIGVISPRCSGILFGFSFSENPKRYSVQRDSWCGIRYAVRQKNQK